MLALVASHAAASALFNMPSLTSPPSLADVFKAVDNAVYAADRQRDELIAGVKRFVLDGEDGLSALSSYAIPAGSTVAVTGATDGLGREAALFLARAGFGVVVLAREPSKGEAAAAYIKESSRGGVGAKVAVVPCDLASVVSVQAAAPLVEAAAAAFDAPLRGLVLNAGVWPATLQLTVDGMETALQACHIGHFQLTRMLLPSLSDGLASGEEARVVTVSSSAHAFASDVMLDDPNWASTPFETNRNYGRAKFANMLYGQELAQRAPPGVRSVVAHPGLVLTSLFKELGPRYDAGSPFNGAGSFTGRSAVEDRLAGIPALRRLQEQTPLKIVLKSPSEGARPILHALLAPGLPQGGFVADCELRDISPPSKSAAAREALWEWTSEWLDSKVAAAAAAAQTTEVAEAAETESKVDKVVEVAVEEEDESGAAAA